MPGLISVIVPVYNAEKYLQRCVNSIQNQSYSNFELILVNDGSTDMSPKICDDLALSDDRIKVIHQKNGGVSVARNNGIEYANGDYITFVDNDDWIHTDYLKELLSALINYDCDISQCDRLDVTNKTAISDDCKTICTTVLSAKDALRELIQGKRIRQVIWGKLYRTEVIGSLRFREGKYIEDEFWTYQVIDKAKRIAFLHAKMYYYFFREDSIIRKTFSTKRLDGLEALVERHDYICDNHPDLIEESCLSVYQCCMYMYQMSLLCLEGDDREKSIDYIMDIRNRFRPKYSILKELSFKNRIWMLCSFVNFGGTCKLRNSLNIGV